MIEYTLTVPTAVGHKIADHIGHLTRVAGGQTCVKAAGSWFNPDTQEFVNEDVYQNTYIVDYTTQEAFQVALRNVVRAMHEAGEHTVLVRRLSGRGLVHWFITRGNEESIQ